MTEDTDKRAWTPPAVQPLTDVDSRADERDVPVQNIIGPSQLTS